MHVQLGWKSSQATFFGIREHESFVMRDTAVLGPLRWSVGSAIHALGCLSVQRSLGKLMGATLRADELDALAPRRGTDNNQSAERVVNQLLTEVTSAGRPESGQRRS